MPDRRAVEAVTTPPTLSDDEVVARAREGDHAAFSVLVERYEGRVHRLALRILRDEERARDASQDAFIKVYGALRRFEGRSSFYSWLYRLVYNHCLDMRRRDKSARELEFDDARGADAASESSTQGALNVSPTVGPGKAFERGELRAQLAEAVNLLAEDARETFLLREVDGLSYAEIAETLGVPKGTVMSRLHNARRALRESLEGMGVTPAGHGPQEVES